MDLESPKTVRVETSSQDTQKKDPQRARSYARELDPKPQCQWDL